MGGCCTPLPRCNLLRLSSRGTNFLSWRSFLLGSPLMCEPFGCDLLSCRSLSGAAFRCPCRGRLPGRLRIHLGAIVPGRQLKDRRHSRAERSTASRVPHAPRQQTASRCAFDPAQLDQPSLGLRPAAPLASSSRPPPPDRSLCEPFSPGGGRRLESECAGSSLGGSWLAIGVAALRTTAVDSQRCASDQ